MKGDDPEFLEAIRLALKFFPEAVGFISNETGIDWELFLGAMMSAEYHADYSCDRFRRSTDPDLGLAGQGGLEGRNDEVYERLLKHTGLIPKGRVVVLPDTINRRDWSAENCLPFVCFAATVPKRLTEVSCFESGRNTLFLFENGMALLVDHDDHVHWARSQIRRNEQRAR